MTGLGTSLEEDRFGLVIPTGSSTVLAILRLIPVAIGIVKYSRKDPHVKKAVARIKRKLDKRRARRSN